MTSQRKLENSYRFCVNNSLRALHHTTLQYHIGRRQHRIPCGAFYWSLQAWHSDSSNLLTTPANRGFDLMLLARLEVGTVGNPRFVSLVYNREGRFCTVSAKQLQAGSHICRYSNVNDINWSRNRKSMSLALLSIVQHIQARSVNQVNMIAFYFFWLYKIIREKRA